MPHERMGSAAAGSAGPLTVGEQVAAAWSALVDRTDAIADEVTLQLLQEETFYAHSGPDMHAELRASCRENIRRGVRTMAGVARPGEESVHVWRETGRRRARQGVPMESVLGAYSIGSRVLWGAMVDQCRSGEMEIDAEVLVTVGQSLWHDMDIQAAIIIDAYRRESARLQRRDLQRQQALLEGLLEGRGADPDFAHEVSDGLGLRADETLLCVVAPIDDPLSEPMRSPEDRLERNGIVSQWHVRGGTSFGIISAGARTIDEVVTLLGPSVAGRVGIAQVQEGLAGFPTAYHLAWRAATTLPKGARRAVTLAERLPEVLLSGSPEVIPELMSETIGPVLALPPQQADMLIETLAALLAHGGSPTHAAGELFCHRNTVIYRMHQLERLTGRSLQVGRDRLLLSLALLAHRRPG